MKVVKSEPATLLTPRLRLRPLTHDDAAFAVELLNDPGWLRYIGDRDVRDLDAARRYLEGGPLAMYARTGLGLLAVEPLKGGAPLGLCGLIRRDGLADVDLGYAFLPAARGRGLAREAAGATLAHARDGLGLPRLVAIVTPDNQRSVDLLVALGLAREGTTRLPGSDHVLDLYAIDFAAPARGADATRPGDGTPLAVASS